VRERERERERVKPGGQSSFESERAIVIVIVIYSKFNQIQYTGHTTTEYRMSQVLLNNVLVDWN
jgi:hypothetical protein